MTSRSTRSRRPPAKQQPDGPEPQSRAKWTSSLTKILADLLVDQVNKGNKQNNSFGKKAWKYIGDEFYNKTGLKWDKEQLKNRFAVLRKQYVITKSLLDELDFKWDEPTGVIVATDETWNNYLKAGADYALLSNLSYKLYLEYANQEHPDAEAVRSTGCPIYKQLCTIFSEVGANGKQNGSAEHEELTPDSIPCPQPLNTFQAEESTSESEEMACEQDKFQSTTPSRDGGRKRGRKGIDDVIANAISEMAAASKLRAVAIKQCNERFSITDCVRALDKMQGVDEQVYLATLDLFNNRNARETFLSLKVEKRLTWLQGKCALLSDS